MWRNVAAMQFSLYPLDEQNRPVGIALDRAMQPGETFQVVGLNKLYLKEFFGDRLSEADLSAIENGTGCIVRNPIAVSVGEGDSLRARGTQWAVLSRWRGKHLRFSRQWTTMTVT